MYRLNFKTSFQIHVFYFITDLSIVLRITSAHKPLKQMNSFLLINFNVVYLKLDVVAFHVKFAFKNAFDSSDLVKILKKKILLRPKSYILDFEMCSRKNIFCNK